MTVAIVDSVTRQTAAYSIHLYQQYLSPHKGFACAYRVLHQGESCSQYAKRMILERGLGAALPLIRDRFQDCKAAQEDLEERQKQKQKPVPGESATVKPAQHNRETCTGCGYVDCGPSDCGSTGHRGSACGNQGRTGNDCGQCALSSCDTSSCEVGGCDVGACEMGGLDCGSCDCGSCSFG